MSVLWNMWCIFDLENKEVTVKQIECESKDKDFWIDTREAK